MKREPSELEGLVPAEQDESDAVVGRDVKQPQDESADPRLRDLIYRSGTVIRLRVQDSDWVWDIFIRAQDGDEVRLGGLPIEPGQLYPLLVMEYLGRGASPFLVVSMCAHACAAGAIVTTETTELFDQLQALITDVRSNGVVEADIKYGLEKKLARRLKVSPPGTVDAPAEPPRGSPRKPLSTTPLPTSACRLRLIHLGQENSIEST